LRFLSPNISFLTRGRDFRLNPEITVQSPDFLVVQMTNQAVTGFRWQAFAD
jgi:hypothetical protein